MINKIKDAIKDAIKVILTEEEKLDEKIVVIDQAALNELAHPEGSSPQAPDLRVIGLFAEIIEDKIAELIHALLHMSEANKGIPEEEKQHIDFYLSTYGGNADDMFAFYDAMRIVRKDTEIHTIGLGKVMSAGVLLLAAGTKGKRKIGKNCRIMIHSVVSDSHGSFHNLLNEMEAVEQIQKMYTNCLVKETKINKREKTN